MVNSDPPTHPRLRKVVANQLSSGRPAEIKNQITEVAGPLVGDFVRRGGFEAVADLAHCLRGF